MFRRVIGGACAAMVAAAPVMASAACFTESEWRAAHVRVLQTELQVAALECVNVQGANYNDQYTVFIQRFQDRLKANANLLKSHFQRVYGKDSGRELDIFVTKVANDASSRSMQDMKFCANSAELFKAALAIDKPQFEQAAMEHVTDHSEVGDECPVTASLTPAVVKTTKKPVATVKQASAPAPVKPANAAPALIATPAAVVPASTAATPSAASPAPAKEAAPAANAG